MREEKWEAKSPSTERETERIGGQELPSQVVEKEEARGRREKTGRLTLGKRRWRRADVFRDHALVVLMLPVAVQNAASSELLYKESGKR